MAPAVAKTEGVHRPAFATRRLLRLEWPHLRTWAFAIGLAATTAVLAQIKLYTPLTPVPYTLQVFGVVLMGGLLGARWGATSAALYVLLGLLGLPVFAGQVEDAGGIGDALQSHDWNRGFRFLETGLSAGFVLAYVPQAWIVGWARDRTSAKRSGPLVGFAPAALVILSLFAALDALAIADAAGEPYYRNGVQAVFFAVLVAGLVALSGAVAWLAYATLKRRPGVELFLGSILGLLVLYAIGGTWFYFMTRAEALPAVSAWETLRFTVFPFLAVDVLKVLAALGLIAILKNRPTLPTPARERTSDV